MTRVATLKVKLLRSCVPLLRTTPYHPMGNGMHERFNQMLRNMVGTLEDDQKSDWKTYVLSLVQGYKSTRHKSIGYSPHFLLFGWHLRLVDDAFSASSEVQRGLISQNM